MPEIKSEQLLVIESLEQEVQNVDSTSQATQ
jgi:hypothetical protein